MNTRQLFTTHSLEELAETARKLRIDATKKANNIGTKLGANFLVTLDTCKKISHVRTSLDELTLMLQQLQKPNTYSSEVLSNKDAPSIPNLPNEVMSLSLIDETWTHQNKNRYLEAIRTLKMTLTTDSLFTNTVLNGKSVIIADFVDSLCNDLNPSYEEFDQVRSYFGNEINEEYLKCYKKKISSMNTADSISHEIVKVYKEYIRLNKKHGPELDTWLDQIFCELNISLLEHPDIELPIPPPGIPELLDKPWKKWVDELQLMRDEKSILTFFDTFRNEAEKVSELKPMLLKSFTDNISTRIENSSKTRSFWKESLDEFLRKFTPEAMNGVHNIGVVVTCLDTLGFIADVSEAVHPIIQLHLNAWVPEIFQKHLHHLFPVVFLNTYPSSHLIVFFYLIFQDIRHYKLIFFEVSAILHAIKI
ncbi:hypothetical protein HMI54_014861 [Coelomomyces lativittatus]|nr:hypothetical protein HMI54_014861 [Coelomomyces lativittatus]